MEEMGIISKPLKEGSISSNYKGGNNYRPVMQTLTSEYVKNFQYLEQGNKKNYEQYGLGNGRACLSQILNHCGDILIVLIIKKLM